MTKSKTPLFSIIIPSFNYAHVLPRAVESAVAQAGDNYEVLVVNDGSSDTTNKIIKPLLRKYAGKLRYIEKENGGPASARNIGIKNSTGNYLIFLDADDELEENALSLIQQHLSENTTTKFIVGNHVSKDETGFEYLSKINPFPSTKNGRFAAFLNKQISIVNGASVIHRDVFSVLNYNEEIKSGDDIPVFALTLGLFPATHIVHPLATIHKHDDSLRHNFGLSIEPMEKIINEIFGHPSLPSHLNQFKTKYTARLYLSVSRAAYLAGDKVNVRYFFHKAVSTDARSLFQLSYLRKYLRSL
jgi:glycosyltransferase involved in cell wall biosynthesis